MAQLIVPSKTLSETPTGKLYALDASDGSTNWVIDQEGSDSSPVAVDGSVYYGARNILYSIDVTDGSENWSVYSDANNMGFPVSVFEGTVYAFTEESNVYAYAAADGSDQWSATVSNDLVGGQYVTSEHLYLNTTTDIKQLDNSDGSVNWSHAMDGDNFASTPLLYNGTVYSGDINGDLYAVAASDGTREWKTNIGSGVRPPIAVDGTLYLQDANGKLLAIDPTDGSELWSTTTPSGNDFGGYCWADGAIYVADGNDDNATQYAYKFSASDGSLLWQTALDTDTQGPPTFFDGSFYVVDDNSGADDKVYSISADGTIEWTTTIDNTGFVGPTYVDDNGDSVGARVGQRLRAVNDIEWKGPPEPARSDFVFIEGKPALFDDAD